MRPGARKWMGIAAYVYLTLASSVILLGYASIWYFRGFSELMKIVNPLNIINFIAVLITPAPGLLLLAWVNKQPS